MTSPQPRAHPAAADRRILILSSYGDHPVFYASAVPALARGLSQRGAAVELVSPWAWPWSDRKTPERYPLRARIVDYVRHRSPLATATVQRWLETHGLADFDLVMATDWATARLALDHGSLSRSARLVVLDFNLMKGLREQLADWVAPGARPEDGGWWPSEQLFLESAFPGFAGQYLHYGIPMAHVSWRLFALYPGHFRPGPDPRSCRTILAGGHHLRDFGVLESATQRLPADVHVVQQYGPADRRQRNPHLRQMGRVSLRAFYAAIASSRFVVIPLHDEPHTAAGVTTAALALMAGRPIVATSTTAIRDYVRHGVNGLLVPPDDVGALAEAIQALDRDASLLSVLAASAGAARQTVSTDAWAEQILRG